MKLEIVWEMHIRARDIIDIVFYAIIIYLVFIYYKHDVNLYNDALIRCLTRQELKLFNGTEMTVLCWNTTKEINGTTKLNPMDIWHELSCDLSVAKPP